MKWNIRLNLKRTRKISDKPNKESIVFVDTEVSVKTKKILDYGAVSFDDKRIHTRISREFGEFIRNYYYICGHNILAHDMHYLCKEFPIVYRDYRSRYLSQREWVVCPIDTLYLSALLFPCKPYHALVKDDKIQTGELNNPLNDSIKAKELFYDEWNTYCALPERFQRILFDLLFQRTEFFGFFWYLMDAVCVEHLRNRKPMSRRELAQEIHGYLKGKICEHAALERLIMEYPIELAYCLALINVNDRYSIIPRWVHMQFSDIEEVMRQLRGIPCREGCAYCEKQWDLHKRLKAIFGYDEFRVYDGNPLQEDAVKAAVSQESLLAIFPTGGGKSLTFQLPALLAGDAGKELTVVISPLQSLMKDQVDNLEKKGIADAVTVNGLLSPLERSEALERVESGLASILYISPEMLRSKTIERLFLARSIARFVIDEAHCFSAWGQDFRVDYLYIGDFIRELQKKKGKNKKIPVSCFTATAKQKVISDIKDYLKNKLDLEVRVFATNAARENLRYQVIYQESEEKKYTELRRLIEQKNCPTIVYASRTKRTRELAEKLCKDGFLAKPFYGKMDSREKAETQDAFIQDKIQVIVATSAFGMGVDKPNVKLVIHYDISDSLENYVQEAGRAGRNPMLQAECYVLFRDEDLNQHFILLNQTKLSISEIQQVWKAIKTLTKDRAVLMRSPLEIARQAGWDETVVNVETRVKTAVQALENAGYIQRGKNVPHIYATSILVPNMAEASKRIEASSDMDARQKEYARRILQMLISKRSIAKAGNEEAESRIDYISDMLGIEKSDVIDTVTALRKENILADAKDLTAYIKYTDKQNKTKNIFHKYIKIEKFLLSYFCEEEKTYCVGEKEQWVNLKELNEKALKQGISSSVSAIKTIFYFWTIKNYIEKSLDVMSDRISFISKITFAKIYEEVNVREDIAEFIIEYLFQKNQEKLNDPKKQELLILFSVLELKEGYEKKRERIVSEKQIEDALLFLSKVDAIPLEGGFLVLYQAIQITRLEKNSQILYKKKDYAQLNEFYQMKIQQIHIVGEYANMMVKDYQQALQFVSDYFQMDYKKFLRKYFAQERIKEMERNITAEKYHSLFDGLSKVQEEIIQDNQSRYIVVAAGPGSGKTKVLVHKLASLLLMEDVKQEQLLMVTFSRAAATEFKQRLYELIGKSAAYIEIKTFHSYCFDLLGKIGRLEAAGSVIKEAVEWIRNEEVEVGKVTKTVVVIDEAQDMDQDEFSLIQALMEKNEEMRVIAVGDDDQNIFQFRGSDSKYMQTLTEEYGAIQYDLLENYRSTKVIVAFANLFAARIKKRLKNKPIIPIKEEKGLVRITHYLSENLEIPVINQLLKTKGNGTIAVLTNTNEEALKVLGLLLKQGIRAKLIQSNDEFELYNLAEIRYFLQTIKKAAKETASPIISDEIWNFGKKELENRYQNSECLPNCLNLLQTFSEIYEQKYLTDFEEFVRESKWEDFYPDNQEAITISTIHKSKGREYDQVYLLLNHVKVSSDEERRKLYVGITRAKKELYIHCNNGILDGIFTEGMEQMEDRQNYLPSKEMISQLSHKDIHLGFYSGKQREMLKLYSGMELRIFRDGLWFQGEKVVHFSKKYREDMERFRKMGYDPIGAKIRFVVAWKGKEDSRESVIVLPDIYYRRMEI